MAAWLSVVAAYVGIGVVITTVATATYRLPPASWVIVLLWPVTLGVVGLGVIRHYRRQRRDDAWR